MTVARKHQIYIETTPYYHCVSRCVRRAFLCGSDKFSGKSYEHRKQWIVDRMKQLSGVFAIDICAYAVLSNHYHTVLRVDIEEAAHWAPDEVVERWCSLFKGPLLVNRYRAGELLSEAEHRALSDIVDEWRDRLMDISWYMRCLNEAVAREANNEDGCKGRFWEGRFKSQALLDETALLTCMMYVDLNPIRAGIHTTPELSEHTSIQERLKRYKSSHDSGYYSDNQGPKKPTIKAAEKSFFPIIEGFPFKQLLPFSGNRSQQENILPGIDFEQQDYFTLLDWTGRSVRQDKRGAIPSNILPILERIQANENEWVNMVNHFGRRFYRVIGPIEMVKKIGKQINTHWVKGVFQCQLLYKLTLGAKLT